MTPDTSIHRVFPPCIAAIQAEGISRSTPIHPSLPFTARFGTKIVAIIRRADRTDRPALQFAAPRVGGVGRGRIFRNHGHQHDYLRETRIDQDAQHRGHHSPVSELFRNRSGLATIASGQVRPPAIITAAFRLHAVSNKCLSFRRLAKLDWAAFRYDRSILSFILLGDRPLILLDVGTVLKIQPYEAAALEIVHGIRAIAETAIPYEGNGRL